MTSKLLKTRLISTAAILVTLATSVALAQVRQVQLGNPMDANPGVGTGGSNQPVVGYVPINGNEIVTGNVAGLKYFHGTPSITSPFQFQGTLGSSNLAGFARQSAGDASGNAAGQIYYLPSATVSTAGGNLYSAPAGSGFESLLVPRAAISPIATSAQVQSLMPLAQARSCERALPTVPIQPGTPGAVLSSPLFSFRFNGVIPAVEKNPSVSNSPMAPGRENSEPGTDTQQPGGGTSGSLNGGEQGAAGGAGSEGRGQRGAPGAFEASAGGTRFQNPDTQRIGSTYADVLAQLSKIDRGANAPDIDPNSMTLDINGRPGTFNGTMGIDPLTGQPRQVLLRPEGPGVGQAARGNAGGVGTAAARPGQPNPRRLDAAALTPKRLEDLPTSTLTAGAKIKPLKTLAPTPLPGTSTAFDTLMARGEAKLKEGNYLESSMAFQNALNYRPDDALALIGWAHADLGAGFYATAANNLKFAYTRRPELISIKYDASSFIPASRVDFLMNDLQTLTTNTEQGNLGSFLYCYLCYQTGRTELLQAELKKWAARPEHDAWQPVLSRAWTSSGAATRPAETK